MFERIKRILGPKSTSGKLEKAKEELTKLEREEKIREETRAEMERERKKLEREEKKK